MSGNQQVWGVSIVAPSGATAPGGGMLYVRAEVQLYHANGAVPTFPVTGTIASNTNFRTCDQCFQLAIACTQPTGEGCTGDFIATAGSYRFNSGTPNSAAGTLTGEANNLVFRAWDLANDRAVTGQPCIEVSRLTWNARWP